MMEGDRLNGPAEQPVVNISVYPDPRNDGVYILFPTQGAAVLSYLRDVDHTVGGGDTFITDRAGFLKTFTPHGFVVERFDLPRRRPGRRIVEQVLGRRRIAGVEAIGRRLTMQIRAGESLTGQSSEIVEERWESPQLQLLIESRYSDPRRRHNLEVNYRLTNIRRSEQPAELFAIPSDYTLRSKVVRLSSVTCPQAKPLAHTGARDQDSPSEYVKTSSVCDCLPSMIVPACSIPNSQ
jgi:hypothetical protein